MKKGFTLIELLVVISLIGVLAVAVLSAINPIEQLNKGRDAGRKTDAGQILGALDRYYAAKEEFPWNNSNWNNEPAITAAFAGRVSMNGVGVCGQTAAAPAGGSIYTETRSASGCTYNGLLVNTGELKSQFRGKKAFRTNPAMEDKIYIYKAANDSSISVCFVPTSTAARQQWNATAGQLKSLALDPNDLPTIVQNCTVQFVATQPTWADNANSCYVCIPE
jgi:prepilin-type N-terminal cleavage/methylation domain-containing protein